MRIKKFVDACLAEVKNIDGTVIVEYGLSTTCEGDYAVDFCTGPDVSLIFSGENTAEFFDETSGVMCDSVLRIDDLGNARIVAKSIVRAMRY